MHFSLYFEIFSFKKIELNREVVMRTEHKLQRSADWCDRSRAPVFLYAERLCAYAKKTTNQNAKQTKPLNKQKKKNPKKPKTNQPPLDLKDTSLYGDLTLLWKAKQVHCRFYAPVCCEIPEGCKDFSQKGPYSSCGLLLTTSCIYCGKSLWLLQWNRASGISVFWSCWEIGAAYTNMNITVPA